MKSIFIQLPFSWRPLIKQFNFESIIVDSLSNLHAKACVKVYGFVIMPNHIHLIWELKRHNGKESAAASLMKFTAKQFQKGLKASTPSMLEEYKVEGDNSRNYNFWQPNPDWFLLHTTKTIEQKLHYIHTNPLQERWALVKDPCDYKYSSPLFYEKGVKEFDFLYDYRDWCEG
jgi:putative transposase